MADYFVVFDHFHGKFVSFIAKLLICLKFFAFCGFPNNFVDVVSPNSWVESKFFHAQRTPKLCPRLLPTFKAWLLSTLFCFSGELYGLFWSDNLEKWDQKSILSWRCHKFKHKRGYNKWNFAFFRLECERCQQLLRWCFETLIVCRSLFVL